MELPVRPGEAAAVAELVIRHLSIRRLSEGTRNRLSGEVATLGLTSIRPYFGSLESDPVHRDVYYLYVDGLLESQPEPFLLRLAAASSPASALFPGAILIGRMQPRPGPEIVVNAIRLTPYGASGGVSAIDTYVQKIARTFLPRPQGTLPSITVPCGFSEASILAAFTAFRSIFRETGINMAAPLSVSARQAEPGAVERAYTVAVSAALRAGWREGYTAELNGLDANAPDGCKDLVRSASGYSKFGINLRLSASDSSFISALEAAAALVDLIRSVKAASPANRMFDIELNLAGSPAPTTPEEMLFCLQWMKSRGQPVQFVAPCVEYGTSSPETLATRVRQLAAAARQCNAMITVAPPSTPSPELLKEIGRSTSGRLNYRIGAGCDAGDIAQQISSIAAQLR